MNRVKRFAPRDVALLMVPVALVGALGWWMSKRPAPPAKLPLRLSFHLDKPTALEAFHGANAAFVVAFKNFPPHDDNNWQLSPYVEVKTSHGVEVGKQYGNYNRAWNRNLWNYTSGSPESTRFLLQTKAIPAGEMHFGVFGVVPPDMGVTPTASPDLRVKPLRLSGKWRVDRAQLKPLSIASWPRKPLVVLREVKITQLVPGSGRGAVPYQVTGEATFDLQGAAMNDRTSLERTFSERYVAPPKREIYGASYGLPDTLQGAPRRRVCEWTANVNSPGIKLNVSGRVSADNRWPLGFQFEPFSYGSVHVGQTLRFQQFPVALPRA